VLDTFIGDGPIALPIGALLALVFYKFAVKLSQGEEIPARWLRISGHTCLALAGLSGLALWGSLMSPVDVACAIWSGAFIGGFGYYAYNWLVSRGEG
jgi:drug/metabolite transporter (DMT)-like permease